MVARNTRSKNTTPGGAQPVAECPPVNVEVDQNAPPANFEPQTPTSPPAKIPRIGIQGTPLTKKPPMGHLCSAFAGRPLNGSLLPLMVPDVVLTDLSAHVGRTVNVYCDIVSVSVVNSKASIVIGDRESCVTLWCHDQKMIEHFDSLDVSTPVLVKLMDVKVTSARSLNWDRKSPADRGHVVIYKDGGWGTPPSGFGPLALPMVQVTSIEDQFVVRNVGPASIRLRASVGVLPLGVVCSCGDIHDISVLQHSQPGHVFQNIQFALSVTAFFDTASPLFSVALNAEVSASLLQPRLGHVEDVLGALQSSDNGQALQTLKAIESCLIDLSSSKWSIYCSGGAALKSGGYFPRVHRMRKIDT